MNGCMDALFAPQLEPRDCGSPPPLMSTPSRFNPPTEDDLREFLDLSIDMLCIAGVNGYFKHLNPAWERTLGYSKEELLSRPYVDFVHPEEREAAIADVTGDFVYCRLMQSEAEIETGYAPTALDTWSQRAREWAAGREPQDLPRIASPAKSSSERDVFVYFINGAKERAPAAAMALLDRLGV